MFDSQGPAYMTIYWEAQGFGPYIFVFNKAGKHKAFIFVLKILK